MPETPPLPASRAVFVSYASQDRQVARRISDALRSAGIEVWFDQEGGLEQGDEWDAKIRRQIKECVFFLPVISATTQARFEGYFRIEWDVAAERAQGIAHGVPFILPIVIDTTNEADALVPERFRKVQWTHLPGGVMSPEVLARLLKLWANRTGSSAPEAPRPIPAVASAPKPLGAPPGSNRVSTAAAPLDNRRIAGPPKSPPTPPPPTGGAGVGAPKASGRFGSLELGGPKAAAAPPEIVKDEAYYVAEAHDLFYRGRFDLALRAYSKVLEYNAANQDAWTAQVRMLVELGELREARLWADKALERFPIHPDLLAAKAVVHARMADLDGALAFSDGAIEERGNTPYVWLARGDVLLARSEDRATYCFEQALTLGRGDWVHLWQASRIHSFHRSFAQGLHYAQQATELAPERAVAWLQAGQCQIGLGNGVRARESLAQARLLDPLHPGLELISAEATRLSGGNSLFRRVKNLFA